MFSVDIILVPTTTKRRFCCCFYKERTKPWPYSMSTCSLNTEMKNGSLQWPTEDVIYIFFILYKLFYL